MLSVVIVALISVITAVPFFFKKKISDDVLVMLLSLSVGTLLGAVFIHFLPEIIEQGYSIKSAIYIITGFMLFLILEKFIHSHHNKSLESKEHGHGHAYHLAPLNLIGSGFHNFLDGLLIAGSYLVSAPLGIAATATVVFHEIPKEAANFGVLLYSKLDKIRSLVFNFIAASMAIAGAVVGIILANNFEGFTAIIIPFVVGNLIYISASNLVPELHRHCNLRNTIIHLIMIVLGVSIMLFISLVEQQIL